jgi:hypothetical protein
VDTAQSPGREWSTYRSRQSFAPLTHALRRDRWVCAAECSLARPVTPPDAETRTTLDAESKYFVNGRACRRRVRVLQGVGRVRLEMLVMSNPLSCPVRRLARRFVALRRWTHSAAASPAAYVRRSDWPRRNVPSPDQGTTTRRDEGGRSSGRRVTSECDGGYRSRASNLPPTQPWLF